MCVCVCVCVCVSVCVFVCVYVFIYESTLHLFFITKSYVIKDVCLN